MYTVIDFETTGLNHVHDAIIQIGAVKLNHSLEQVGVFEINVRVPAGKTIPAFITDLTGITYEENSRGLLFHSAFDMLKAFAEKDVLIAHNAPFDLGFYYEQVRPKFEHNFYDTRSMIKISEPGTSAKLADVCERRGITIGNHHNALSDAQATAELFKQLHREESDIYAFHEKYRNVVVDSAERPLQFTPPNARVIQLNTL